MKVLVIGTGPAALLAADRLLDKGARVSLYEKRPGPGRKLLIAGASGLNVTYDAEDLTPYYREGRDEIATCLRRFGREDWLRYIHELGLETFRGTSRRYFLKAMKASPLLRAWLKRLNEKGAEFHFDHELVDFATNHGIEAKFQNGRSAEGDALLLALGGGSYDENLTWPALLRKKGLDVKELRAANVGYHLEASPAFFEKAEGKPLKGIVLRTKLGAKAGELMITRYGLEGTPIYTVGATGEATLDLKPDLEEAKLMERLKEAKGTPWKRLQKTARLSPGALLLAEHLAPPGAWDSVESAARTLKHFPISLKEPRPILEAISTSGGLAFQELTPELELKKYPRVFAAGEMLDWDAPTGGFLIQGSVATGFVAAEGIAKRLGLVH